MSHSKNHGIQPMYKWMMAINDFIIIIIIKGLSRAGAEMLPKGTSRAGRASPK